MDEENTNQKSESIQELTDVMSEEPKKVEKSANYIVKRYFSPWLFMLLMGIILFIVGLCIQIPSTKLTTHSYYKNNDDYYYVETYLNGDAYNYIVAAAQNGGEISATTTEKTIYISVGLFMFTLGGVMEVVDVRNNSHKDKKSEEKNNI